MRLKHIILTYTDQTRVNGSFYFSPSQPRPVDDHPPPPQVAGAPMIAALRSRLLSSAPVFRSWTPGPLRTAATFAGRPGGLLDLPEVEKILTDVKAGDVRVIPVGGLCDWTDFMVIASGRSTWHVRNIAQALLYKVNPLFFFRYIGNE